MLIPVLAPPLIRPVNEKNGKEERVQLSWLLHQRGSPAASEQLSFHTAVAIYSARNTNSSPVNPHRCNLSVTIMKRHKDDQ